MKSMKMNPEMTRALCQFCYDIDTMETRIDLINCVEDHYLDEETDEPARVLDILKSLRNLKRDMEEILKAMKTTEDNE